MPRISCLIATNRVDNYLVQAIQSITSQSYRDFEIIIILNGSALESSNLYSHSKVRYIKSIIPGLVPALNLGIQNSDSEFIARMDADDVSHPDRFDLQIKYFGNHNKTWALGSNMYICDSELIIKRKTEYPVGAKFATKTMLYYCSLAHPTVMMRSNILRDLSGYGWNELCEDHDLWLRSIRNGYEIDNLPQPLLKYRMHENQMTQQKSLYRKYDLALKTKEFILKPRLNSLGGLLHLKKLKMTEVGQNNIIW